MRMMLLAVAGLFLAAPAFADDVWTGVPVHPSTMSNFVGDSVVWGCGASGCTTQSDTSVGDADSECRALARQVGVLSSYTAGKPFDTERLARCNKVAEKQ